MKKKIPCPSCREPNFDTDIVCWKCGMPLKQAAQPDPLQAQLVSAGQMNVLVPPDMARPDRRTLLIATLAGGIAGMAVSLVSCVPMLQFADAASIPLPLVSPYLLSGMLTGALVGLVAVLVPYGVVVGLVVSIVLTAVSTRLIRASGAAALLSTASESGWGISVIGGFGVAAASLLAAMFAMRFAGSQALPVGLRGGKWISSPGYGVRLWHYVVGMVYARDQQGNPASRLRVTSGLLILVGMCLLLDVPIYLDICMPAIKRVRQSPAAMVSGYVWITSQRECDPELLRCFLTRDLAARFDSDPVLRQALDLPFGPAPTPDAYSGQGLITEDREVGGVEYSADRRFAELEVDINPASGEITSSAVVSGAQRVLFRVRLEDGKWRIADAPVRVSQ